MEGVQIELNKENAPNVLLEDFNYFANKAINQYVNKRYNIYDVNQQTTDDLRVLKADAYLRPHKVNSRNGLTLAPDGMATYEVTLPSDYLHLLNCVCIYNVQKTYKCYNKGDTWRAAATRLTADAYSQVLDNFWVKPSYKRPYYYIHNTNIPGKTEIPTNPYNKETGYGTDLNIPKILKLKLSPIYKADIEGLEKDDADVTIYETLDPYYIFKDDSQKIHHKIEIGSIFHMIEDYDTGEPSYWACVYPYQSSHHHNLYNFIKYKTLEELLSHDGDIFSVEESQTEKDSKGKYILENENSDLFAGIKTSESFAEQIHGLNISNIQKTAQVRYGNASAVRMEIRYGTDTSVFTLDWDDPESPGGWVYIDYVKAPQHIRLTQKQVDLTEDTSQILEFPDYVCQEILNELVNLIMEHGSDPRLQTRPVVSQSIANPAQAQAPTTAAGQTAQQQ